MECVLSALRARTHRRKKAYPLHLFLRRVWLYRSVGRARRRRRSAPFTSRTTAPLPENTDCACPHRLPSLSVVSATSRG